jgi:hypothetical protein
MSDPIVGSRYRYNHTEGLGQQHTDQDLSTVEHPSTPGLTMADLDLEPGTVVVVDEHDQERDLVLVGWVDRAGNPRVTSIDPAVFADHFERI